MTSHKSCTDVMEATGTLNSAPTPGVWDGASKGSAEGTAAVIFLLLGGCGLMGEGGRGGGKERGREGEGGREGEKERGREGEGGRGEGRRKGEREGGRREGGKEGEGG